MPNHSRRLTWLGLAMAMLAGALLAAAGTRAQDKLIEKVESLYNDIYLYRRDDDYLVLSFGARRVRYIELIVNPKDELELPVTYTRAMTVVAAYAPELSDAAMIGLGGGRTSWYPAQIHTGARSWLRPSSIRPWSGLPTVTSA